MKCQSEELHHNRCKPWIVQTEVFKLTVAMVALSLAVEWTRSSEMKDSMKIIDLLQNL